MALLIIFHARPLAGLTFGNDCYDGIVRKGTVGTIISANQVPSRICFDASVNGVGLSQQVFNTSAGRMPLFVTENRNKFTKKIIIEIIGGPGSSPTSLLGSSWYIKGRLDDANMGVTWITPSYIGTKERAVFPAPAFDIGAKEIVELVNNITDNNPNRKLYL